MIDNVLQRENDYNIQKIFFLERFMEIYDKIIENWD